MPSERFPHNGSQKQALYTTVPVTTSHKVPYICARTLLSFTTLANVGLSWNGTSVDLICPPYS